MRMKWSRGFRYVPAKTEFLLQCLTKLQDREANRTSDPLTPDASQDSQKMDNEKLMSFFSGLLNKGPSSSPRGA